MTNTSTRLSVVMAHSEELNDLHCSLNIYRLIKSRRMRWAGHLARVREGRDLYRVLAGKSEGKRPLGRHRRRWDDYIKMDLQKMGCGGVEWIDLAPDRDIHTYMHSIDP